MGAVSAGGCGDVDVHTQRRADGIRNLVDRRLLVGVQPRPRSADPDLWLGDCTRSPLELTHRPALRDGFAGQPTAGVVVRGRQQRTAVPLRKFPALHQIKRIAREVQQTDQVGDRDAAPADSQPHLLAGQPEFLYQGGTSSRLRQPD